MAKSMHDSIKSKIDQFIGDLLLVSEEDKFNILIEDKEDIQFWRLIFESLELKPVFPEFPSKATGKAPILQDYYAHLSDKLVICVDSDNDHLHETNFSSFIKQRPKHLFHTHTHSRENHFIYPDNLALEYEGITYEAFDFKKIFNDLSEALHPWLLTWLFFNDRSRAWLEKEIPDLKRSFSWKELEKVAAKTFQKMQREDSLDDILLILSELNNTILLALKTAWESIPEEFSFLKIQYNEYSETPIVELNETLFFIQGHCAFDTIIMPLFNNLVRIETLHKARKEKEKDKQNHWLNKSKEDYRRELSQSYKNCLMTGRSCKFIKLIQNDIAQDFTKNPDS